jgi:hypothetical protein
VTLQALREADHRTKSSDSAGPLTVATLAPVTSAVQAATWHATALRAPVSEEAAGVAVGEVEAVVVGAGVANEVVEPATEEEGSRHASPSPVECAVPPTVLRNG